jgi:hypothetical protein
MASMSYWKRVKTIRQRWASKQPQRCMICGASGMVQLDVHEAVRRSASPGKWGSPANLLLVCRRCHDTTVVNMPLSVQLSFKLLNDPDHFNLATMSKIAGRKILLRDVVAAAKRLM